MLGEHILPEEYGYRARIDSNLEQKYGSFTFVDFGFEFIVTGEIGFLELGC